ncbi:MAG: membrane protein insertase YidC [Verrucomicrobia bacterium]|nr:membrane protein insertase YidC [Verrucomicrobiota bacterium]
MDRKSILVVVACLGLLMLWSTVIVPKLYPPKPLPPGFTNTVAPPSLSAATNAARPMPGPVTTPGTTSVVAPQLTPPTDVPEETMTVANENVRYTFTSRGGGLKLIELVRYPETVTRKRKQDPLANGLATLHTPAAVPVLSVLGDESLQGDGIFTLMRTSGGMRAEKTLTNGLRVVKEFQLSTNYLIQATVRWENTSSQPLALPAHEWVIGTATPMGPDDRGENVGLMWYNGGGKEEIAGTWFENRTLGCFPGVPRPEYRAGSSNVFWASAHNQFFALVAMPDEPALQIVSRVMQLPRPSDEDIPANFKSAPPQKGYLTSLAYPGAVLAPGQSVERQFNFFTGPKEYRTLAMISSRFQNNVDMVMGFGWFGFFSKALLLSMNWFHQALGFSYGWAIIAITFIIKMLFWPLTTASTRSMKRMAALQPQMKALQEKYKEDPAKMNRKLMEFMRENKVSPLGGCLPMLLQMPVFIGFFYMIRTAIELRGASFLWVADLSKPDTLFVFPGINFPFNLLPLLMGATMLWQARLTPPAPGMDPVQQKMMKYLPLMFMVFLYNFSAGLTLYWTVQNLLTIAQTKLTKTATPTAPATPATSPVLTPVRKNKK